MVDAGLIESALLNPVESEDLQILIAIDAVSPKVKTKKSFSGASMDQTEVHKPGHLISGSSGTGQ
jgi:hypothetical protein